MSDFLTAIKMFVTKNELFVWILLLPSLIDILIMFKGNFNNLL